ncbi:hypothetical protein WJX81_008578 [Elliptochloris bilobata]|uniref:Secreted protein n=1 Tax=Elliptochloris bilobata TaxID=381761 RepID=A0AAW1RKU0_9CHLO
MPARNILLCSSDGATSFLVVGAAAFTATLVWALPSKEERLSRAQLTSSPVQSGSASGEAGGGKACWRRGSRGGCDSNRGGRTFGHYGGDQM